MKNKRIKYLLITLVVICLGLASRKFGTVLPPFIASYSGDVLWASMIYFGIRFLFPSFSIYKTAFLSLTFCFLIELSQLYQALWINTIRETTVGALILGHGFLWSDLLCYTVGVTIAFLTDKLLLYRKPKMI